MKLSLGGSAIKRDRGDLPEMVCENMILEVAETEPDGFALQSRPGLVEYDTCGSDVVVGVFQKDGVCDGAEFTVTRGASTKLYKDGALLGTLTGTGPVSFAGNEIGLAVACGGPVKFYDGTALGTADFPDGANVCKIVELAGRFIALRAGTQAFYWTLPIANALVAGILTFDPLDFASAENEPDQLFDACVLDDRLILAGSETIEFWTKTGDDELPFIPTDGMVFEKGVRSTGCLQIYDNSFAFISDNDLVYRAANVPERMSDTGVEEDLANSASASLFTYFWEGHECLALRLDDKTRIYDAQTQRWFTFKTGDDNWLVTCATAGPIFGGPDGALMQFGGYTDLGTIVPRKFRAGMTLSGGTLSVSNLKLRCNVGNGEGGYNPPVIEMRSSRNAGKTWGTPRPTPLGRVGEYRAYPSWRALGMYDAPGALFEFTVSDPVDFRVSAVYVNEPGGGRARD